MAMVLTLDVDRFKQINDTYGHPVGDECLKTVATRLLNSVRQEDTVARTGGEEFILLVVGFPNSDTARRIGSKILDLFQEPVLVGELEIKLTVSIGGAIYPEDGLDADTLRKRSDQALYEAKRSGRNRAVFATEKLSASSDLETAIESRVREGLETESFRLFYQPIYNAKGAICRFEALLRTTDTMLSELGPAGFIPVAESSGLIFSLGRWVLERTCLQILEWQSVNPSQLPIGVNVSGQQLTHKGFAEEVVQILRKFQIDPWLLELEVTETTAMAELASVVETMAKLAASGITFAIDDFGTGYSSLSRLHDLPIKALKIDRSFVVNLEIDGGFRSIVQAIIQMAKSLNLKVVAEGVETQEQFDLLSELGCDFFQGYLLSRPLPAEEVLPALAENRARLLNAVS
jgi:diguanylate cyclase (GGDEF)-like protein